MKIFISWSGEGSQSQHVAKALKEWLPLMFQNVEPWYSKDDIYGGDRWNPQISEALDKTDFGILCLDRSNPSNPWLVFEAGAISKSVKTARVVPYLIEMDDADVPSGPLDQFQSRKATAAGTRKLVQEINDTLGEGKRTAAQIDALFDALWPQLETSLGEAPGPEVATDTPRPQQELLEEILDGVRRLNRKTKSARADRPIIWRTKTADGQDRFIQLDREGGRLLDSADDITYADLAASSADARDLLRRIGVIKAMPVAVVEENDKDDEDDDK